MKAPALVHFFLVTASFVIALLALPRETHAIERQHHVGLGGSLSMLTIDDKTTNSLGGGLWLHYAYGLTDTFNLMAEVSSSAVARDQQQDTDTTPRTRPAGVDHGAFGVGYVIDILQWVPYICVLGGAYRLYDGTLPQAIILPGVQAGVGLDYQLTRHLAVGAGIREHLMISKLKTYPSYMTAFLRVEYMWGY